MVSFNIMLPTEQLSDDYSCLIWTTSREEGQRLLSLEPQAFVNHVNHAYVSFITLCIFMRNKANLINTYISIYAENDYFYYNF